MEGGGIGGIQQSMIQSNIAKGDGKGGVMDIIGGSVVKGVDTNVLSTQTGNIDAIGQQFGGALGLQSAAMVGLDQLKSAFGFPDVIGEMKQTQSELSEGVQRVGNVLRLEGVSPPQYSSPGQMYSPDPTPMMSHGGPALGA
jgi:hypothetical protein